MSTAFEFLGRENRRIRFPRLAMFVFLGSLFGFVILQAYMVTTTRSLGAALNASAARVEVEAARSIDAARQLMPKDSEIVAMEKLSAQHNLTMGGSRSSWTKLFNTLDRVLPEDVVITAIENPRTNRSLFGVEDREFRLRLAVTSIDAANYLYMKFSNEKAFGSLSFTPKGEIKYQDRTGLSVELMFIYNDKI